MRFLASAKWIASYAISTHSTAVTSASPASADTVCATGMSSRQTAPAIVRCEAAVDVSAEIVQVGTCGSFAELGALP